MNQKQSGAPSSAHRVRVRRSMGKSHGVDGMGSGLSRAAGLTAVVAIVLGVLVGVGYLTRPHPHKATAAQQVKDTAATGQPSATGTGSTLPGLDLASAGAGAGSVGGPAGTDTTGGGVGHNGAQGSGGSNGVYGGGGSLTGVGSTIGVGTGTTAGGTTKGGETPTKGGASPTNRGATPTKAPAVAAQAPAAPKSTSLVEVTGWGCYNSNSLFKEVGRYTDSDAKQGWVWHNDGGYIGNGCKGGYDSAPMSGSNTQDIAGQDARFEFHLPAGKNVTCQLSVWIPPSTNIQDVGGNPTLYTVYHDFSVATAAFGNVNVSQVANRGRWVGLGSTATSTGELTLQVHTRGVDWTGNAPNYAHHAIAQAMASCSVPQ